MRIPRWRFVVGPFLTVAIGVAIMVAGRYGLRIPNAGALQILAVLIAAYVGGTAPGLASAAIAIVFGLVFIEPADLFALEQQAVIRFLTLLLTAPAAALIVGLLRGRERRAFEEERRHWERAETANRELAAVRAALDHIDEGLILLDENFRVQFMNAAFRKMWSVPDALADSRPGLDEAARYMMSMVDYAISPEQREAFVADRIAKLRADVAGQSEVRLSDGRIIRSRSRVLPQGGRMLSYVDVTDIMRHSDELERLRAALEYVDEGVVLLDRDLRILFMNRASREIGGLFEYVGTELSTYPQLIETVAAHHGYAVPEAELAAFLENRKKIVAAGDAKPVELRMSDGDVIRFRCAALPDGDRLLLYTDITDLARQADQLEKLATTDGLTGLYNRRHFLHLAEAEWSRFERHGRPMSLLMLDIDRFKSVNDRFGHDAGDQVIVGLAAACREGRRVSDVVARVGGEEFALLLPETEMDAALGVAERLRERVAASQFLLAAKGPQVTVSIGVAAVRPGLAGIAALMKEADQALYEAKRRGRNRVVAAGGVKLIAAPEATLQPSETLAPKRVTN